MEWGVGMDTKQVTRVECSAPLVGDMVSVTSDRVRMVTPYRGIMVAIYRDGSTARHTISSSLSQTSLTNFRVSSPDCAVTSKNNNYWIRTTTPSTTSTTTVVPETKKNFYTRIQSANLRWPSKAERSVSMKHPRQIPTTDNPLHIFYPPDNNNEQVTSHLLNNANTFHAKSFLIIVVLVFFLKS